MVSVIVAAYNAARWAEAAIQSVLAQTYHDWELVLVDDGSVDGTGCILDHYAQLDSRIRVIHQANCGVSVARNVGIEASKGEWVTFMDADDLMCPRLLDTMIWAVERTGAGIISSRIRNFDTSFECPEKKPRLRIFTPAEAIRTMWLQKGQIDSSPCGKLFARSLFAEEQFRPGIRYEDLDIMYRLFAESNMVAAVSGTYYGYRQHSESFIHKFSKSRLDVLDVTARMEVWAMQQNRAMVVLHCGIPKRLLLPAAWDRRMSACFNVFMEVERARRRGEISDHEAYGIEAYCYAIIKELRINSMFGLGIRLKNRVGALLSIFGPRVLCFLSRYPR